MEKLEEFILKSIENIREDRAVTKTLLTNLMKYMIVSEDRHKEVGMIAAKYVETLQRSNEQLVKLTSLVQKQTSTNNEMTEKDKDDLFDMIQGEPEDGE
jgi:adenine-specific DNA methylase|tara:strand:+ start:2049 stop:2345 length:297 start_codon:yes stop_codon:yes gene_type:complete